jgi:hypothetical protein
VTGDSFAKENTNVLFFCNKNKIILPSKKRCPASLINKGLQGSVKRLLFKTAFF